MPSRNTGTVKTRLARKRRLMSSNSGFLSSSETLRGSSAMPQMGARARLAADDLWVHRAGPLGHSRRGRRLGLCRLQILLLISLELRLAVRTAESDLAPLVDDLAAFGMVEVHRHPAHRIDARADRNWFAVQRSFDATLLLS